MEKGNQLREFYYLEGQKVRGQVSKHGDEKAWLDYTEEVRNGKTHSGNPLAEGAILVAKGVNLVSYDAVTNQIKKPDGSVENTNLEQYKEKIKPFRKIQGMVDDGRLEW